MHHPASGTIIRQELLPYIHKHTFIIRINCTRILEHVHMFAVLQNFVIFWIKMSISTEGRNIENLKSEQTKSHVSITILSYHYSRDHKGGDIAQTYL